MKFDISQDVIKRTTKCPSNFYCLDDTESPMCAEDTPMCPVEIHIEKSVLFVKAPHTILCPYKVHFGTSYICTCPVRYEISKQYNK